MNFKKIIEDLLIAFGIGMLVVLGWQGLEILMVGKINPNNVDSVIGLILTFSLYANLKLWRKNK